MFLEEFLTKIKQGILGIAKLGRGNYNFVFKTNLPVSLDGTNTHWVIKKPMIEENEPFPLNEPNRAVRKWRLINPHIPAHILGTNESWTTPYLGDEHPSDELIKQTVIEVYQRTGNIIADAGIFSNFILFEGRAVCVDVDLALHRDSISSEYFYNTTLSTRQFDEFFKESSVYNTPLTQETIKTLFYLEDELSDYEFDRQLVTPFVIEKLNFFRDEGHPVHYNTLELLHYLQDNHFSDEYICPKYLNKLSLSWRQDMAIETVMQLIREIQEPLEIVSDSDSDSNTSLLGVNLTDDTASPPEFCFFNQLNKRNCFSEIISRLSAQP